jgi:hypothetical protein
MGADKNASPKRELGLYPKFTTTDSHTSLPRSRSHFRRTNPTNNPQPIPKRKHEARSKGLSYPKATWADCPRSPRERSATHGGLSVKHKQNDPTGTLSRGRSVPRPRPISEQLVPRGKSATSWRTVRQTPSHQKPLANWIETKALKNTRRTLGSKRLHADSPHPPRGQSVRCERTRDQQPESQLESTLPPILPWISQTVEALQERFGEDVKRP